MTVGANAPTSVVFDTPHRAAPATCGSNRSVRLDGGAHTTPRAAIARAERVIAEILARCCTLSLAQLIAAVDAPPSVVIDAVLGLAEAGSADLWSHHVDTHLVVGLLDDHGDRAGSGAAQAGAVIP
ncbi:hypothetical protein AB4Z55_00220 [Gordonia sp. ABKF26]